jgi:hypothetical protein
MQQAQKVYQFLQENPGKVDQTIDMLKQENPQVLAALQQLVGQMGDPQQGGGAPSAEAPPAEAPGMGAPYADENFEQDFEAPARRAPGARQDRSAQPSQAVSQQGGEVLPSRQNQGAA